MYYDYFCVHNFCLDNLFSSLHKQVMKYICSPQSYVYDCFLSHKRSEAKDFARALHTLFVTRGIKVFLDYEFR